MSTKPYSKHTEPHCCDNAAGAATVIHLPVAPQVVARTRFSPPTVLHNKCMLIPEALQYLDQMMDEKKGHVSMVAITGPGDPLATPDVTLKTILLVRERYPALKTGLKTLGIGSGQLASSIAQAGVNYIEMHVDAIQTEILEKLYAWIRPGAKTLKLTDAASLLIMEQRNGVPALKFHNISVSILTTLYPGFNIDHVPKISAEMMELGADTISLLPYCSDPDTEVCIESPSRQVVAAAVAQAERYLPTIEPALINLNKNSNDDETAHRLQSPKPTKGRPNVAVASSNGIEVDLHLGQAIRFLIYGPREDGLACLLETRDAPEPGTGSNRWQKVSSTLNDCFTILTTSAGETPRHLLAKDGLKVTITEENIEGFVDVLYGGDKKKKKRAQHI